MDEKTLVEKFNHELYHHGTKGQKWGVRRYQNPDGSLTPAGKRRYGTKTNFERVKAAKKAAAKAKSKEALARQKAKERTEAEIAKYRKKAGLKDKSEDETSEVKKNASDDDTNSKPATDSSPDNKNASSNPPTDTKKADTSSTKIVIGLDDDELRDVTNRARAEKDYLQAKKDLADAMNQTMSQAEKRKKDMKDTAEQIIMNSMRNIGTQTVTYLMGAAVNKLLAEPFNDPQVVNPKKGQKDK